MAMPNVYQQYKSQSITTMTGGELLVMLYDELIKDVKRAELAIDAHKVDTAHSSLMHAQDIIGYLAETLDNQYEISDELSRLYQFFTGQLIQANISKDAEILREVLPMLMELRDTWKQAEKLSRMR